MNPSKLPQVDSLLADAKAGNSVALGSLFALYQNYIRLLAATQLRARLRVRASASDVAQDTFLKAHRGFDEFRGNSGGEFVVWLRSILSHQLQYLIQQNVTAQARDVRREISLEDIGRWMDQSSAKMDAVLVANDPSPATQFDQHERSVRVADAMAALPDDYREIIMLRSIEELGYPEIAEQFGRSQGAVRMLWLRAIEALRDALQVPSGNETKVETNE